MKWYSNLSDFSINDHLISLSNESIQLMQEQKEAESMNIFDDLYNKVNELIEYITSIKYVSNNQTMHSYFTMLQQEMNTLLNNTELTLSELI